MIYRGDSLPLGVPKLMMVANGKDLDWKPELFEAREQRRGYKVVVCSEDNAYELGREHFGYEEGFRNAESPSKRR